MKIRYLSYGLLETGGFRHEQTLYDALVRYCSKEKDTEHKLIRYRRLFKGPLAWIKMLFFSYRDAVADINIVPVRLGLGAIFRNFRSGQVWIVLHNYDENDGKSILLKWYHQILFTILKNSAHGRFKVICVAPYWLNYLKNETGLTHVYLFPNLFDTAQYKQYIRTEKNAWVHLGQYSTKNDPELNALAGELSSKGYYCFYSTLEPSEVRQGKGQYDVLYFLDFKGYLDQMSRCCCTLALSKVKEGWNRIAHESILVGTPVIGYDSGGLGDLLRESHSIIVKNTKEAYNCITESVWMLPGDEFNMRYDLSRSEEYLKAICRN